MRRSVIFLCVMNNYLPTIEVRWIVRQIRPFIRLHMMGISVSIAANLLMLTDPLILQWIIDKALPSGKLSALLIGAGCLLIVYLGRIGLTLLSGLIIVRAVQQFALRIRKQLMRQINSLSCDFNESVSSGKKIYYIQNNVDQIADVTANVFPHAFRTLINTIFVTAALCYMDYRLTFIILSLLPILYFIKKLIQGKLEKYANSYEQYAASENSFLQEHLSTITTIQLLGRERYQERRAISLGIQRSRSMIQRRFYELLLGTGTLMIVTVASVVVLVFGGYGVLRGTMTVGGLVAFYSYLARLFDPINVAIDVYSKLTRISPAIKQVKDILNSVPSVKNEEWGVDLNPIINGEIHFKDVSFSYSDNWVLDKFNLQILAGENLVIAGHSGSGKSTISRLCVRLYDAAAGEITLDGVDIKKYPLKLLRKNICYVPQDSPIFDDSLENNIRIGNLNATNHELKNVIEIAELSQLVSRLPDGLSTNLGPGGFRLSSGERQRVSLARVIIRNSPILILDEATTKLDSETEAKIFENLRRHNRNITLIIITHRLSAIRWADRIVVIENGFITANGTHDDLIQSSKTYCRLYGNQDIHSEEVMAL